jgi:hypothetical protein
MVVNDTVYNDKTPRAVINILERARQSRERICIRYGDPATGRNWGDPRMCGRIGRSTGTSKIPLLIKTARSTGGEGILDHAIIRITAGEHVLYEHPKYKARWDSEQRRGNGSE